MKCRSLSAKNVNNSEVEILLPDVNTTRLVLFSSISGGHRATDTTTTNNKILLIYSLI